MNRKTATAALSVASNTFLIAVKLAVGIVTGSVSVLSEAIHSLFDLIAAIIAFFSVRLADTPPDTDHPYGHGKIEGLSGMVEALLIFAAAGLIIFEAVKKIMEGSEIAFPMAGVAVMALSAGVNIVVSRRLYKVAKETGSIALEADALHLKTDVYTSAGVAIGLLLLWVTDIHLLDPIVAIAVACLILYESYQMLRKALSPLVDKRLSDEEIALIHEAIQRHHDSCIGFHEMRTRSSGNVRYVDLHLELPKYLTVEESHRICDAIETDIEAKLPRTEVTIHVEPCTPDTCATCDHRTPRCG
ncbi:MAG TPA: cation diffusion facilitator family transporter [bacterium]|nr:cation diffusion facilitator family transporter [bacterium]